MAKFLYFISSLPLLAFGFILFHALFLAEVPDVTEVVLASVSSLSFAVLYVGGAIVETTDQRRLTQDASIGCW